MVCSITSGTAPTVKQAASTFQSLCYDNRDSLMAGIIVAGWDERNGGQVGRVPRALSRALNGHRCSCCRSGACVSASPLPWAVRSHVACSACTHCM